MRKSKEKNRGITLIALVVNIIVLLILALLQFRCSQEIMGF